MNDVVIFGAGGHGRVVADVAVRCGYRPIGFVDDACDELGPFAGGHPILGRLEDLGPEDVANLWLVIAIGQNEARQRVAERALAQGWRFATLVHPSAQVGSRVTVGPGTVVMANVVINTDARIGAHVIINTAATVDHDCAIDDFVHIGPGSHLAGHVSVGKATQIGIGSRVTPGVAIADHVTVGAGATVIRPVGPGLTVVGTPAKPIPVRV